MNNLLGEYKFYLKNKPDLLKKYLNKFIIIKDNKVIGDYNSYNLAFNRAIKKYDYGTFLIQQILLKEPVIEINHIEFVEGIWIG